MLLLFDIGGTNMRIGISRDGATIAASASVATPQDFDEGLALLAKTAATITKGQPLQAAAGGIAGVLNAEHTQLLRSPNLKGWVTQPLTERLRQAISTPVFIHNDAALATLGEAVAGAGQGHRIVAYLTISTGVGGARVVDQKIDANALGFEPGQQIINGTNTLENIVSGTALEQRYGKNPAEITDETIWDETARWLAIGLTNTIVHWSPHVVVLGGGMILKPPGIGLDRVAAHLKQTLIFPNPPPLRKALLGDASGLHGALVYLHENI